MEVDDMIFLHKSTRAGLLGVKAQWPNGIIPYAFEPGIRKINSSCFHYVKNIH